MGAFIIIMAARQSARKKFLEQEGFVFKLKMEHGYSNFKWVPQVIDNNKYWFFAENKKINKALEEGVLREVSIQHGSDFSLNVNKMNEEMKKNDYVLIKAIETPSNFKEVLVYEKTGEEFENYYGLDTQESELISFKNKQDKLHSEKNG